MSTRIAKQIIYGALFLIVLFLICAAGYFVFVHPFTSAPAVVCTPSTCAPTSTAPLSGTLASTFVTGTDRDTFLGQITNASMDFGASIVNYEIDLYDSSNNIVQSAPGQTFIYGNQSKYVLIPNVAVSGQYDHAALNITSVSWIASSTLGVNPTPGANATSTNPTFGVQNVIGTGSSTTVSVGGQITNGGISSYEKVIVMVLFKDVNGGIAGASQTELDNVTAGETANFSVIYPASPAVDPNLNQVIIYALR